MICFWHVAQQWLTVFVGKSLLLNPTKLLPSTFNMLDKILCQQLHTADTFSSIILIHCKKINVIYFVIKILFIVKRNRLIIISSHNLSIVFSSIISVKIYWYNVYPFIKQLNISIINYFKSNMTSLSRFIIFLIESEDDQILKNNLIIFQHI